MGACHPLFGRVRKAFASPVSSRTCAATVPSTGHASHGGRGGGTWLRVRTLEAVHVDRGRRFRPSRAVAVVVLDPVRGERGSARHGRVRHHTRHGQHVRP